MFIVLSLTFFVTKQIYSKLLYNTEIQESVKISISYQKHFKSYLVIAISLYAYCEERHLLLYVQLII